MGVGDDEARSRERRVTTVTDDDGDRSQRSSTVNDKGRRHPSATTTIADHLNSKATGPNSKSNDETRRYVRPEAFNTTSGFNLFHVATICH